MLFGLRVFYDNSNVIASFLCFKFLCGLTLNPHNKHNSFGHFISLLLCCVVACIKAHMQHCLYQRRISPCVSIQSSMTLNIEPVVILTNEMLCYSRQHRTRYFDLGPNQTGFVHTRLLDCKLSISANR